MIDKFLVEMRSEDGNLLGSLQAFPISVETVNIKPEDIPYVVVVLDPTIGTYSTTGNAMWADVFTENPVKHFAKVIFDSPHLCNKHGSEKQPLVVWDTSLDTYVEPVCVCGAAKTYGKDSNLHADWCDAK